MGNEVGEKTKCECGQEFEQWFADFNKSLHLQGDGIQGGTIKDFMRITWNEQLTASKQREDLLKAELAELKADSEQKDNIIKACSEHICIRCLFTSGYDPEPDAMCCGAPNGNDTGVYCCGHPEPDWRACRECGGAKKPITKPTEQN